MKDFITKHHLKAKSRGGVLKPSNCLKIWRSRHTAWHVLFHNDTLDEIISKLSQNPCAFANFVITNDKRYQAYVLLWRNKPVTHILKVLKRLRRIKRNLGGHRKV